MRKKTIMGVLIALIVIISTFFSSCSSVGALLKSNISGLPYWYYQGSIAIGRSSEALVGEGKASTQRQAMLLACSDVIRQLSERIGYTLSQEVYRELTILGTIADFGLVLENEFSQYRDGEYSVYVQAVLSKELLERATSSETKRRSEILLSIENLVLEGDAFIKNGQELRAVKNYLQAMALSYDLSYVESQYSFDALYDVVVSLLEDTILTIAEANPQSARCTLNLSKKGRFVSSAITSAEILATFNAIDIRGENYKDSFVYVTDANGNIEFNTINNALIRTGSVIFSLNLDSEIEALLEIDKTTKSKQLKEIIDSKKVEFAYSRSFSLGPIAISVIEHNSLGYVIGTNETTDYLVSKYENDNANASAYYALLGDEEDVLYEFQTSQRTETCLVVIRVAPTTRVESLSELCYVGSEGMVTLFDARTSDVLYKSDIILGGAFAPSYEEAQRKAFENVADIAYSLLKVAYV